MSALGARRLLTPSGITRAVMRLEERGLVRREPDPEDRRAAFAVLTKKGLAALRRAQRVHHATVRELYLGRLNSREQRQLARLFEKALPGVVSSPEWSPPLQL
jgi:DNA-binding MarR family transcriptional regulator